MRLFFTKRSRSRKKLLFMFYSRSDMTDKWVELNRINSYIQLIRQQGDEMLFHRFFSCIIFISVLYSFQSQLSFYTKTRNVLPFASLSMFSHVLSRKTTESNLATTQLQRKSSQQCQDPTSWVATAPPSENEKSAKRRLEEDDSCPLRLQVWNRRQPLISHGSFPQHCVDMWLCGCVASHNTVWVCWRVHFFIVSIYIFKN